MAGALSSVGSNNFAQALGHRNGTVGDEWRPRLTVVFGPEHAEVLAAEGLD